MNELTALRVVGMSMRHYARLLNLLMDEIVVFLASGNEAFDNSDPFVALLDHLSGLQVRCVGIAY